MERNGIDWPSWIQAVSTTVALAITVGVLVREQLQARRRRRALLLAATTLVGNAQRAAIDVEMALSGWHSKEAAKSALDRAQLDAVRAALDAFPIHEVGDPKTSSAFAMAQRALAEIQVGLVNAALGYATAQLYLMPGFRMLERAHGRMWKLSAQARSSRYRKRFQRVRTLRRRWLRRASASKTGALSRMMGALMGGPSIWRIFQGKSKENGGRGRD